MDSSELEQFLKNLKYSELDTEGFLLQLEKKIIEHQNILHKLFQMVSKHLPGSKETSFEEGALAALLGCLQGFAERELDPLTKQHISIFREVLGEIHEVYTDIQYKIPDRETWLQECYDYGIKSVYYLDWKLYLSQILY
ncbi:MAG: hypothetical protein H7A25_18695 [Leptospiraceae bacterium]|nr:hypothetical protein [Leptospiraceae bacterium]MCP5501937.1 hypothetical protein [Leptospiraceae bacterium]